MLPPFDVTPLLSKALRYSSATDLRCSSVIVCRVIAMRSLERGSGYTGPWYLVLSSWSVLSPWSLVHGPWSWQLGTEHAHAQCMTGVYRFEDLRVWQAAKRQCDRECQEFRV